MKLPVMPGGKPIFIMDSIYNWKDTFPDMEIVDHLSRGLDVPQALARALVNRGIGSIDAARAFMDPDAAILHSPDAMPDMDIASDRVIKALRNHEKILVLGDYDVDGITGTALLVSFLENQGGHVKYYIPDRITEGYGLSSEVVRRSSKAGYGLIVTVDSGISSIEEARVAAELGIDLVITDHHEPHEELPGAVAVLNPKRRDTTYPFRELAGVGVAFKLLLAIGEKLNISSEELLAKYIEIVALGTVGDLVPLLDENRFFVRRGLSKMARSSNLGLYSLLEVSHIREESRLDTYHISFVLAPRINAAGRIWNPRAGVELLMARSAERAHLLACKLDEHNRRRIDEESRIFKYAVENLEDSHDLANDCAIVLFDENWHIGVVGIVASKLMERHHRPVILTTVSKQPNDIKMTHPEKGRVCQGSARSVEGFDLYEALKECSDLLITYGGHALAAGIKIYENDIPEFRRKLGALVSNKLGAGPFRRSLKIDAELPLAGVNMTLLRKSRLMEPCGIGNPKPVFRSSGVSVLHLRPVGADGRHLQLRLGQGDVVHDAIGFGFGDYYSPENLSGEHLDIAFVVKEDNYSGRTKPKLHLKDLRVSKLS